MSWTEIQNAVQEQFAIAGGLPADKVIWQFQNADRPTYPYAALTIGTILTVGQDYVETTYDAARLPGQEIKQEVRGMRDVALELEVFTGPTVGDNAAVFIAERIRTALLLPSVREPLFVAGIAPFDPGPVQYLPTISQIKFQGRATCTIRCYMGVQDVAEYTTYIARVSGTITAQGGAVNPAPISYPWDTQQPGPAPEPPIPGYQGLILSDGPILFYRLNDVTGAIGPADSSTAGVGQGFWLHGELITLVPSILPAGGAGEGAQSADSVDAGYDSVLSPPSAAVSAFTIEWWVVPRQFGHLYNSVGPGAGLFLCQGEAGGDIYVGTNGDDTLMHIPAFYTLNALHHVVYTFGAGTGAIYRNGILVQTRSQSDPTAPGPASWGPASEGNWFGSFANVALYDKVLTEAQIQAHYRAGIGI